MRNRVQGIARRERARKMSVEMELKKEGSMENS